MRTQNSLVFQKARNKFIAGISIPYKLDIFFDITLFRNIDFDEYTFILPLKYITLFILLNTQM